MKRRLYVALALVVASLLFAVPAFAAADCPQTMEHSVASLVDCINQAVAMGHVTSPAVAHSLLAKAEGAQSALAHGQNQAAIGLLQALVREVQAQSGQHIDAGCAGHMAVMAQAVIASLRG